VPISNQNKAGNFVVVENAHLKTPSIYYTKYI
jgi:hypothetical protein